MTLHLLEQSATLRLRQGRLCLELDEAPLVQVPARKVRAVVVWGNVRLTFLLRQGVPVLYASLEGQLYGQASTPQGLAPEVLRAQLKAQQAPLALARGFLGGKLRTAAVLVERLARQAPSGKYGPPSRPCLRPPAWKPCGGWRAMLRGLTLPLCKPCFLLSKTCTKMYTVFFLPRSRLGIVSDRRDFPDYDRDHLYCSAAVTGQASHG